MKQNKYKYVTKKQPLTETTVGGGWVVCWLFVVFLTAVAVMFFAVPIGLIFEIGWGGLAALLPMGGISLFCSMLAVCYFKGRKDHITFSTQGITLCFQPKPECWEKAKTEFLSWEQIAQYKYESIRGRGINIEYLVIELIGETEPRRYNVSHFAASIVWIIQLFDRYVQR